MTRLRGSSFVVSLTFVATAGSLAAAAATPLHQHHPAHMDRRAVKVVDAPVPGPIKFIYELNGEQRDQTDICNGIRDGTLRWAEGTENPPDCPANSDAFGHFTANTAVIPAEISTQTAAASIVPISSVLSETSMVQGAIATTSVANIYASSAIREISLATTAVDPITKLHNLLEDEINRFSISQEPAPALISSASVSAQSQIVVPTYNRVSGGQGLDREFPDGEIDCTVFPSEYGPISIDWAYLGGWSGIQYVTIEDSQVIHIDTAIPGGDGCKPGAMCSYACPPGYQKSQWPSAQGATGQSVGGLSCNKNGKLVLTNPGLSKTLCIEGTGAVNVQNKLSSNAAICRTDYPGTENEVVPLNTEPASTSPLTCPDASTYYTHEENPTSAQYYVNNQGIALEDACIWGSDGSDMGNWAPSYFGVGQDVYGKTFLSISTTAQDDPSKYRPLNYTVKISGDISGNCGHINGQYCTGEDFSICDQYGCTVELYSGQATYILEDAPILSN